MDIEHSGWELDQGDDVGQSGSLHRRLGHTEAIGRGARTQTG